MLSTTACSSSALTGGEVTTSSYPQIPPPTSPERGSAHPPSWWPQSAPVVSGRYRELHSTLLDEQTRILEVSEAGPDAQSRASGLLVDEGYDPQDFLGQRVFIGAGHMVTVAVADLGFGEVLVYTLAPAAGLPGMPELGDLDLGTLLGGQG